MDTHDYRDCYDTECRQHPDKAVTGQHMHPDYGGPDPDAHLHPDFRPPPRRRPRTLEDM